MDVEVQLETTPRLKVMNKLIICYALAICSGLDVRGCEVVWVL